MIYVQGNGGENFFFFPLKTVSQVFDVASQYLPLELILITMPDET